MNIQNFINKLSSLLEEFTQNQISSQTKDLSQKLTQMNFKTNSNLLELVNSTVEFINDDENYCEIGCDRGINLIGALFNHQDKMAYAVDRLDDEEFNQLTENLTKFNLDEQVFFCNQNYEEFFADLKELQPDLKIGVYFYNSKSDYRSTLMGLLLVRPFLADQALIIINNSNYILTQQAIYDFINGNKSVNLLLELPVNFDHGITILTWDINQTINYNWQEITQKLRNILAIKVIDDLHFNLEFQQKPEIIKSLITEGVNLYNQGKYDQAIEKNKQALLWDKYNSDIYHCIALIYLKQEQYQQALNFAQIAVNLDSSNFLFLVNLATILEKLEEKKQAIKIYQEAIKLDSSKVGVYERLGRLLIEINQTEQAKLIYQKIIELDQLNLESYIKLGDLLLEEKKYIEAIEKYEIVLKFRPTNIKILEKLSKAFENIEPSKSLLYSAYINYYQNQYDQAIEKFEKIFTDINIKKELTIYIDLANCYRQLGNEEKSRSIYLKALEEYPNNNYIYLSFISDFKLNIYTTEDQIFLNQLIEQNPKNLALKIEAKRILPILYNNQEEIKIWRNKFNEFINYLDDLINSKQLLEPQNLDYALTSIGNCTNFYVAYQYQNDRDLQQKYGNFVDYVMGLKYPQWMQFLTIPPLTKEGKIKIGYVSMSMNFHTVGKLSKGWLKHHNKEQFEIYCYYGNLAFDQMTNEIKNYSNKFYYLPNNFEKITEQIYQDQLHILVFIEVGMETIMTKLSALRLAPIQCTTWCHPVTSGSPKIDYFLSSELMEPENAQEHYTETLIKLPNIGVCYDKPQLPQETKTRSDFNLKEDKIIYLCCQSTFKYLPQYDYILAEIAKQVPQSQFVFLKSNQFGKSIIEQFNNRLNNAFNKVGLNSDDYCLFLSQLNQVEYYQLNLIADIFLDSFGWSGGNTTLEAIACDLPIVTCPGEFMRSRHSYGILKMLGVEETIAQNEQEYINIAVKLGLDQEFRNKIKEKIKLNQDRVFNDLECVKGLEQFYQKVVYEKLNKFN